MIRYEQLNLDEFLNAIQELTKIAIVGGYLRDAEPKDVDIIMLNDIPFHEAIHNKFGGYKLTLKDGTIVDIWCVDNHHSVLNEPVSFENISDHLLLNIMGCVYYPINNVVDKKYLTECMNKKEIDFIVDTEKAREQILLMTDKIQRLQKKYDLRLSKRLEEAIKQTNS